jgi:hypothetical protein
VARSNLVAEPSVMGRDIPGWYPTPPGPHPWMDKVWKDYVHTAAWLDLHPRGADIPQASGIYFLWCKDKGLLYVGKSGHIFNRLSQHAWAGRIPFRFFSYFDCEEDDIAERVELAYICGLEPPYNKGYGPIRWNGTERMARLIRRLWRKNFLEAPLEPTKEPHD